MRWWRRRSEEDFDEEIRSHLRHETDRLVAEGLSRVDAESRARRAFGDVPAVREWFRSTQPAPRWEHLARDFMLALRSMRREPWLAAFVVATLALGIGLNTAIFTVFYGLALRPLPLPDADRLVTVHQAIAGMPYGAGFGDATMGDIGGRPRRINGSTDMVSYPEYLDYREVDALSGLAAFASIGLTLDGETPSAVTAMLVTCDYFRVLRAGSVVGRTFVDDECGRPGGAPVVVLDHGLWQRRFGGDSSIVGRTITLNRSVLTVVGVARRGFGGTQLRAPDVYLPVTMQPAFGPDRLANEDHSWLSLAGRVAPGSTIGRAETELTAVARRRDEAYVDRETSVLAYRATLMGRPETRPSGGQVTFTVAVAGLIVLIACLNVTNLLLSRAPARQRNVRIRLSIGASRRRIVTQLLVESNVFAGLGGLVGLLLAYQALPVLLAAIGLDGTQLNPTPDLRVLGYAAVVSLGAAVLFGLTPALEITRIDLATALRSDGAAGGAGRTPRIARLRNGIIGAQVAGSMLLLVIAVLFTRGVGHARSIDPGYQVNGVLGIRPALEEQGYDAERAASYYRELRSRVAAIPGVRSASLASFLPLGPRSAGNFQHADAREDEGLADYITVSEAYFETLGIPIERGRGFSDDEALADVRPAVISQTMARRYWPDTDAIGEQFRAGSHDFVVVGVARDTRPFSIEPYDRPMFYAAARLDPLPRPAGDTSAARPPSFALVVHTTGDASVVSEIQRVARDIDPAVLISTRSLEDRFAAEVRPARLIAIVAGLLGAIATLLAIIGVYGAIAYAVSRRRREIGIRFALGAEQADILGLILRQGVAPVVGGIAAGTLLAIAAARLLRSLLFGFSPLDPVSFLGAGLMLLVVAALAMVQPARRAADTDPASTLRAD